MGHHNKKNFHKIGRVDGVAKDKNKKAGVNYSPAFEVRIDFFPQTQSN